MGWDKALGGNHIPSSWNDGNNENQQDLDTLEAFETTSPIIYEINNKLEAIRRN